MHQQLLTGCLISSIVVLLSPGCSQDAPRTGSDTRPPATASVDAAADTTPIADGPSPDALGPLDAPPPDASAAIDTTGPTDGLAPVDAGLGPDVAPQTDAQAPVQSDGGAPDSQPDSAPAAPGSVIWQVSAGTSNFGLGLDSAGNIVVGGAVTQAGQSDLLLARYSQEGTPLMRKQLGGPQNQSINALKVAADGTVVITGSFEGSTDFGGQTKNAVGEYDLFVASYTPEASLKSVLTFGSALLDEGYGLLVDDASGDWIVTGFGGEISVGTQMVQSEYLLRLAPSGTVRWARQAGGTAVVEVTKGGPVIAAGAGFDLSGISAHAPGSGIPTWMQSLGADVSANALATDRLGRVLVAGVFTQTLNVRGQNVQSRGGADLFLMALAPATGQVIWSDIVAGSQGDEVAFAVCADPAGNIYLGGAYEGSEAVMLGEPKGQRRSLIAKYSEDGTRRWAKVVASPSAGVQSSMICDAPGGLVVGLSGAVAKLVP